MCPFRKTARCEKRDRVQLLLLALITLCACTVTTQAQRPGTSQSAREVVRAIGQKEMDRLLLLKPIVATKDDSARRSVLKQVSEDFKSLQDLNNKMMAQAWSRPELDYHYLSEMISRIRLRATRLKANLVLPEPEGEATTQPASNFSDAEKFRAALLQLDRHIMSFATNPLFQKPDVVEVGLANRACRDLSVVVELSEKLKKSASKLSKATKNPL